MLTLTAACPLPAPETINLAMRNCPAATSCQPVGTCQSGLPSLDEGAPAPADINGIVASPTGGGGGGRPARETPQAKRTGLTKSNKDGFWVGTNSALPD